MSVIACFPQRSTSPTPPQYDSAYDYTPGEKCLGRFLNRKLYQTTLTISSDDVSSSVPDSFTEYPHNIANIDIPLSVYAVGVDDKYTTSLDIPYSKICPSTVQCKYNARSYTWYANSDLFYIRGFTKTCLRITISAGYRYIDTFYVTLQYFKIGE